MSLVGTASLEWCEREFGIVADPRRIRANIVIDTDEPFVEETWTGREVSFGDAVLRVVERIPRFRMIDIDQDGVRVNGTWLKPLAQARGGCMGTYLDIVAPGNAQVTDAVVLR